MAMPHDDEQISLSEGLNRNYDAAFHADAPLRRGALLISNTPIMVTFIVWSLMFSSHLSFIETVRDARGIVVIYGAAAKLIKAFQSAVWWPGWQIFQ